MFTFICHFKANWRRVARPPYLSSLNTSSLQRCHVLGLRALPPANSPAALVTDRCRTERPPLRPLDHRLVACHHAEQFLETQAA